MQPNLREQMLMQGQVDGVFGYVNTIRFSAKLIGVGDDKLPLHQLRRLRDGSLFKRHHRLKKLVKENPKAVAGSRFVRSTRGCDRLDQGTECVGGVRAPSANR